MQAAGLWMFLAVAAALLATGLPAFVVLIGVSGVAATIGVLAGAMPFVFLTALPPRIVGLLENDLLQALPLYVLVGALLNRLPLADILFRSGERAFKRSSAAPALSGLGLGAMLAPMNGSVGASIATLTRVVLPRLNRAGVPPAPGLATVCVASTLGVVVPPSLVLILLGDAMMRAHTEAVNKTGAASGVLGRIVNTQDVFHGAMLPALLLLMLSFVLCWRLGRASRTAPAPVRPLPRGDLATAIGTATLILGLLGAVAIGYLYAVEAAATGAFALFLFGISTRTLTLDVLRQTLADTMATTGALFALLVAATTFTLVFRGFESDRLLAALVDDVPGGPTGAMIAVLALLGLCAFALDAFEIIFVVIPLVMPPLLVRVPDAIWVSTLTLLALQTSFLLPPMGYAIMMARGMAPHPPPALALARALAPFLLAQLCVMALVVAVPRLAHLGAAPEAAGPKPVDAGTAPSLIVIPPAPGGEDEDN